MITAFEVLTITL